MRFLPIALLLTPIVVFSQKSGIEFTTYQNLHAALTRAKTEKKMLLVDCYATWCIPCKKMDQEVFTNDTLGFFTKDNFISIKVQMDTSKNDDALVKSWYREAKNVMALGHIKSFPTYLVFSQDGELVDKEIGYKGPKQFLEFLKNSKNQSKQYYSLVKNFSKHTLDNGLMPYLINRAVELGDIDLSQLVIQEYISTYLDPLANKEGLSKDDLIFLDKHKPLIKSTDYTFNWILNHSVKADSIFGSRQFSKNLLGLVIFKEEVSPVVAKEQQTNIEPDWRAIRQKIASKYPTIDLNANLDKAKIEWYRSHRKWELYCRHLIDFVDNLLSTIRPSGMAASLYLNNNAWEIFQYSYDKNQLARAVEWADLALSIDAADFQTMDTKANLLYKIGMRNEAIELEKAALKIIEEKKIHDQYRVDFSTTLKKMQEGIPTWDDLK